MGSESHTRDQHRRDFAEISPQAREYVCGCPSGKARSSNPSSTNPADNVDNFNLQYFDENNNLLAQPIADSTMIRAVEVSLTIRQTAGRADDVTRTIAKQIFSRNLSF